MPYIPNPKSIFGRLKDDRRHPYPDPLENQEATPSPTPSPYSARRRLPLSQRPPVSSITTTTRKQAPQRPPVSATTTTKQAPQRPPVSSITTTTRKQAPLPTFSKPTKGSYKPKSVTTLSTKGTDVRRSNSLNNEIRRAQFGEHIRSERVDFGSSTPPTRRRLGDELEVLQVQQVVDITTPESARTHVPTAVTANAVTVTRKRRPSPEDIAVSDAVATMASMSKRRRHVTSTTNITNPRDTTNLRDISSVFSGSTTGGTPTSMRSTGSIGRTASWLAAPPVEPTYEDFSFGPPCEGCLAEYCVNMRAVRLLKTHALKFFSPEVHDLPALIPKNGQRRHALFNWNKYNTGISSIKRTPYCVVMFARKWFPEQGQVFKRPPPPQAASSPPRALPMNSTMNSDDEGDMESV